MPEKTIRDRWRFAPTVPLQRPVRGNRKTGYRKGKDIKQGLSRSRHRGRVESLTQEQRRRAAAVGPEVQNKLVTARSDLAVKIETAVTTWDGGPYFRRQLDRGRVRPVVCVEYCSSNCAVNTPI